MFLPSLGQPYFGLKTLHEDRISVKVRPNNRKRVLFIINKFKIITPSPWQKLHALGMTKFAIRHLNRLFGFIDFIKPLRITYVIIGNPVDLALKPVP